MIMEPSSGRIMLPKKEARRAWRLLLLAGYRDARISNILNIDLRRPWKEFQRKAQLARKSLENGVPPDQDYPGPELSQLLDGNADSSLPQSMDVVRAILAVPTPTAICGNEALAELEKYLATYLGRLSAVAMTLGLAYKSAPATWAVQAIHNGVIGHGLIPSTFLPDDPFRGLRRVEAGRMILHLRLDTTTGVLEVALKGDDSQRVDGSGFTWLPRYIHLAGGAESGRYNWFETKTKVMETVAKGLDNWNSWLYREYESVYVGTLEKRMQRVEALRKHLISGAAIMDKAEKLSLARLADAIGVDFPRG